MLIHSRCLALCTPHNVCYHFIIFKKKGKKENEKVSKLIYWEEDRKREGVGRNRSERKERKEKGRRERKEGG